MRLNMTRDFYIPRADLGDADIVRTAYDDGSEAYSYTNRRGRPAAIVFQGKAQKPHWHFSFFNDDQRAKRIAEWRKAHELHAEMKANMKAERNKPHTLKLGDILVSSWGYDQTNIDFYEVTRVISGRTVEIRKLKCGSTPEIGYMTAECWPLPGEYAGAPLLKRASAGNSVKIEDFASAHPWNGEKRRYSWYA